MPIHPVSQTIPLMSEPIQSASPNIFYSNRRSMSRSPDIGSPRMSQDITERNQRHSEIAFRSDDALENVQLTPKAGSSHLRGTPPPLSQSNQISHLSQLPTPQSPGSTDHYVAAHADMPDSPLYHSLYHTYPRTKSYLLAPPFMTPDSSPLLARKVGSARPPETPGAGPSSLSPVTPRSHSQPIDHIKAETGTVTPLAPAHVISPPSSSHSRIHTPSSRLSSPFMNRLPFDHVMSSSTFEKALTHGVDDPFSPDELPRTPPPLPAPVPQRVIGGEIHRIRLQLAADQAAHFNETEARRPDYLVREKRPPHTDSELRPEMPDLDDREPTQLSLGVTESPVKGRRLKLFQETSEESFEQSLLAGGYPGYGSLPSYGEQNGTSEGHKGNGNGLSQRAMQWLQQATPGRAGPSAVTSDPEQDWIPSEKEIRKRKRLAAFQNELRTPEKHAKVRPVEIEGKGRVLLNVPEDGIALSHETPLKKRSPRRRKKNSVAPPSPSKRRAHELSPHDEDIPRPNWPDSNFPWSMRAQERAEQVRLEQAEKLKAIERFLDRDSDEDEEEEDQVLSPPVSDGNDASVKRGRGKMIPVRANNSISENALVPSDPADARAVLLSKKSVRELAHRRQQQKENGGDNEEVLCVCQGEVDDLEVVQCDDCHVWYHLSCIGIHDIAELGEEEDLWFCNLCLYPCHDSDPPSEPTFVPTDDEKPMSTFRDTLFFQSSPSTPAWHTGRAPKTPVQGRDPIHTFSSRSWEESSEAGPSTPYNTAHNTRVYNTPGFYDLFDPSTTPSRCIVFNGQSAPRTAAWSSRSNAQFHTPVQRGRELSKNNSGSFSFSFGNSGGLPFSPTRNIYSFDDTPVRRAKPLEEWPSYGSLQESPTVAGRGRR